MNHTIYLKSKPSHWKSCRLIQEQIVKSLEGEICHKILSVSDLLHLTILDHRWLESEELERISHCSLDLKIDWYVYGDLTLKLSLFAKHYEQLKKFRLTIIVASLAQKKLIQNLFPFVEQIIIKEYPLNTNLFNKSGDGVKDFCTKFRLGDGPFWGYVGRISPQKGICELMEVFLEFTSLSSSKLILAGPIDPHPFWQFGHDLDQSFLNRFQKLLLLGENKIVWIKDLDQRELPSLYRSLEYFVSPSSFHDEDYGLSVSEALACGTPCLLTSWGGYNRYAQNSNVSWCGLKITERGYRVDKDLLFNAISKKISSFTISRGLKLDSNDRRRIMGQLQFLDQDGFDIELYQKIYDCYLR